MPHRPEPHPVVRYRDETENLPCPYGEVTRVVTGGEGGVANVHVVRVTEGHRHVHAGYHEVYYVLAGSGELELGGALHELRPGAVAVIPAGVPHALRAEGESPLEFVIFGVPPVPMDDPRARPGPPRGGGAGREASRDRGDSP